MLTGAGFAPEILTFVPVGREQSCNKCTVNQVVDDPFDNQLLVLVTNVRICCITLPFYTVLNRIFLGFMDIVKDDNKKTCQLDYCDVLFSLFSDIVEEIITSLRTINNKLVAVLHVQ